jgi:hypothetical protein
MDHHLTSGVHGNGKKFLIGHADWNGVWGKHGGNLVRPSIDENGAQ